MGGSPNETIPVVATRHGSSQLESIPVAFTETVLRMEMEDSRLVGLPPTVMIGNRKMAVSQPIKLPVCISPPPTSAVKKSNNPKVATKTVAFGNIEMRAYTVIMGDHPCCTMGCPLSLGWEYSEVKGVPLDEFEASRVSRNNRLDFHTTWKERRHMLSDVSDSEIRRAQRRSYRERSCRAKAAACATFFRSS